MKPDFVSHHVITQVAAIGDIILLHGIKFCQYLVVRHAQQRTDDMPVFGRNARESMNACAAQQVDNHSLHGVVLMMSHTDACGMKVVHQ